VAFDTSVVMASSTRKLTRSATPAAAAFAVACRTRSGSISMPTPRAPNVFAAAITWLRPEVVPPYRLAFFGAALAMVTSETSTYTQPIVFFFVLMEPWKGWERIAALVATYILCIPGDIMISGPTRVQSFSFIGNRFVLAEYAVSLGMILRPFIFMLPAYFLSFLTIKDVWLDIRRQGWATRPRFFSDLPLLPGVAKPSRISTSQSSEPRKS